MKAARTTRARGASSMRPPGLLQADQDLDVSSSGLLSLGCRRGRLAAVSATLGPAAVFRHDQEKCEAVFPCDKREAFARRSCLKEAARNPSCHSVDQAQHICRA